MATNVIELVPAEAGSSAVEPRPFMESDAEDVREAVAEARAICHIMALAVQAQADGAVCFDDATVARWGPCVDAACDRLRAARTILNETAGAPSHDWWTALNLLEGLGAAMWHCERPGRRSGEILDESDLVSFVRVAIRALDSLLEECESDDASSRHGA